MKKRVLFLGMFLSSFAFADKYDVLSSTVDKFKGLTGHKALAVAVDENGAYASSWGYDYSTTDRAIASAMKRCKKGRVKNNVQSECIIYMTDIQQEKKYNNSEYVEQKRVHQSYQHNNENFSKNIPIPNKFLVKTSSGCGALNPNPTGNERIKWTGKCVNGRIDGFGTLTWYKNGKKGSVKTGQHYKNGFALKISTDDWEDHMITSSDNKECSFVMPSSVSWTGGGASKLTDVKFEGGCGDNYQGKVNIYFNHRLFAIYRGKLTRGNKLPVNGELEYFSGDVYKMGSNPQGYLTSGAMIEEWYDEAHLIRSGKSTSGLSDNDFKIKIGFNTKPTNVKAQHGNLIGFDVRVLSSSNSIVLKYDIKPKNRKKLTKKQYRMTIEVKMDYTETGSVGIFSVSEDKVLYEYVQIVLKRANGYKIQGKTQLRKMSTFQRGLGVNITKGNFKPSVRVVSID